MDTFCDVRAAQQTPEVIESLKVSLLPPTIKSVQRATVSQ